MKSIKLLLTSVLFLLSSFIWLFFAYITGESHSSDLIGYMIGFFVFIAACLVFFILGWVIKDNPKIPKDKDYQDTNNK